MIFLPLWSLTHNKRRALQYLELCGLLSNSRNYPSTDNIPVYSFTGHPQSVTLLLQGRGMNTNNYKIVHMFRQKGMWREDVHNSSLCVTRPALRETSSWVAHRFLNAMAELLTQVWLHCSDLNKCAFNTRPSLRSGSQLA